jgi:hypothetical protein
MPFFLKSSIDNFILPADVGHIFLECNVKEIVKKLDDQLVYKL